MPRKSLPPGYILAKQKIRTGKKQFSHQRVHKAASELGAMGGQVGGPARAEALSSDRRSEIAYHAAMFRWKQPCNCSQCQGMLDRN